MKAKVVINEQHSLFPDQERALKEVFEEFELVKIRENGMKKAELMKLASQLIDNGPVVFASPVPILMGYVAYYAGYGAAGNDEGVLLRGAFTEVYVFHNDRRVKKESNGKIISAVAKEGWELVKI